MKKIIIILVLIIVVISSFSFGGKEKTNIAFYGEDSTAIERKKYFDEVMADINDKKDLSCDSVFTNIKTFTGTQKVMAKHMMWIMSYWGEALGVSCTHCHNPGNWASDEKPTKQIAREMYQLRVTINNDILRKIKGLQSKEPRINCGTCHQGKIIPRN